MKWNLFYLIPVALLVAQRKKPTPQQMTAAKTIVFAKQAQRTSLNPREEAQRQLVTVRNVLTRRTDTIGEPPYDLEKNWPSPKEVAILYNLDPNLQIRGKEGTVSVSVLFELVSLESPADAAEFVSLARDTDSSARVSHALSILAPEQCYAFALQTMEEFVHSLPVSSFSSEAHRMLGLLRQMQDQRNQMIALSADRKKNVKAYQQTEVALERLDQEYMKLLNAALPAYRRGIPLAPEESMHHLFSFAGRIFADFGWGSQVLTGYMLQSKAELRAIQQKKLFAGAARFADRVKTWLRRQEYPTGPDGRYLYGSDGRLVKGPKSKMAPVVNRAITKPYESSYGKVLKNTVREEDEAALRRLKNMIETL